MEGLRGRERETWGGRFMCYCEVKARRQLEFLKPHILFFIRPVSSASLALNNILFLSLLLLLR